MTARLKAMSSQTLMMRSPAICLLETETTEQAAKLLANRRNLVPERRRDVPFLKVRETPMKIGLVPVFRFRWLLNVASNVMRASAL